MLIIMLSDGDLHPVRMCPQMVCHAGICFEDVRVTAVVQHIVDAVGIEDVHDILWGMSNISENYSVIPTIIRRPSRSETGSIIGRDLRRQ